LRASVSATESTMLMRQPDERICKAMSYSPVMNSGVCHPWPLMVCIGVNCGSDLAHVPR
jgi:hypothetical protein